MQRCIALLILDDLMGLILPVANPVDCELNCSVSNPSIARGSVDPSLASPKQISSQDVNLSPIQAIATDSSSVPPTVPQNDPPAVPNHLDMDMTTASDRSRTHLLPSPSCPGTYLLAMTCPPHLHPTANVESRDTSSTPLPHPRSCCSPGTISPVVLAAP